MVGWSTGRFLLFPGFMCLLTAGCGGGTDEPVVRAGGRVTAGGRPLVVEGRESGMGTVEIKFLRITSGDDEPAQP